MSLGHVCPVQSQHCQDPGSSKALPLAQTACISNQKQTMLNKNATKVGLGPVTADVTDPPIEDADDVEGMVKEKVKKSGRGLVWIIIL